MRFLFSSWVWISLAGIAVGSLSAGQTHTDLRHNPFARPVILAAPSAQEVKILKQPVNPAEELKLTATLVSNSTPLIIVGGEMLGIGETIAGYRLVAVKEGIAVFDRDGERHTVSLVDAGVEVE